MIAISDDDREEDHRDQRERAAQQPAEQVVGRGRGRGDVGGDFDGGHDSRTFGLSAACARSMRRLTTTAMIAVTMTMPMTMGMSPCRGRRDGERADAREGEDLLDDHRAADHADELHGEEGERGAAGVAQDVLVDDTVRAEAAAAERADVVAGETVQHRSAHLLRDRRDAADRQGDDRQRDAAEPAGEGCRERNVAGRFEPVRG